MPSYETAAFHAQQAAEKALKALLIHHQADFPRTHDLGELLRRADAVLAGIANDLAEGELLGRYAVDTRYPFGDRPVSHEEALEAFTVATNVVEYIRSVLAAMLGSASPDA